MQRAVGRSSAQAAGCSPPAGLQALACRHAVRPGALAAPSPQRVHIHRTPGGLSHQVGSQRQQHRRPLTQVPCAALPPALVNAAASAYTSPYWDYIWFALAAVGAYIWVKIFNKLASSGAMDRVRLWHMGGMALAGARCLLQAHLHRRMHRQARISVAGGLAPC